MILILNLVFENKAKKISQCKYYRPWHPELDALFIFKALMTISNLFHLK